MNPKQLEELINEIKARKALEKSTGVVDPFTQRSVKEKPKVGRKERLENED